MPAPPLGTAPNGMRTRLARPKKTAGFLELGDQGLSGEHDSEDRGRSFICTCPSFGLHLHLSPFRNTGIFQWQSDVVIELPEFVQELPIGTAGFLVTLAIAYLLVFWLVGLAPLPATESVRQN